MLRWFRRDRDEDDIEEVDDAAVEADGTFDEIPDFALVVAATVRNGWHLAAVLAERSTPAFYVRALTVRWPFVVARPVPSNRRSQRIVDPRTLSPSGSTPARKLVVNWGWEDAGESVQQLRFYVKHAGLQVLQRAGPLTVRVTLKQSAWPRQRFVVPVKSNPVAWRQAASGNSDGELDGSGS